MASSGDKKKLLRQQLILLNHAKKCVQECSLPYCQDMKAVQSHLLVCENQKDCSFKHCMSSRRILKHASNCKQATCVICAPVTNMEEKTEPTEPTSSFLNRSCSESSTENHYGNANHIVNDAHVHMVSCSFWCFSSSFWFEINIFELSQ